MISLVNLNVLLIFKLLTLLKGFVYCFHWGGFPISNVQGYRLIWWIIERQWEFLATKKWTEIWNLRSFQFEVVKQVVQICFNLFCTTILHFSLCVDFIEGKSFETDHKIMYSSFPITQHLSDYICMAWQSPCNAQWNCWSKSRTQK